MQPIEATRSVLAQYGTVAGRARRSEFWWFQVALLLVGLAATLVDWALMLPELPYDQGGPFSVLVFLLTLVPSLTVSVRRLHDRGSSGWWLLLTFVPFAFVVLLVWFALDGTAGPNRYGPDPKPRFPSPQA